MLNLNTKAAARAFPVLAAGRPKSNEPFFGTNGEVNASSNVDLIKQFGAMFQAVASGQVTFDKEVNAGAELSNAPTLMERRSHVIEAFRDRTTNKWNELGSSIGAVL
jgi:cytidine deaminase